MEHKWIVYTHINKINGKRYIGITSRTPETRWGNNGNQYTKQKHPYFYNAIRKYGWDNFDHIVLLENLSESEAKENEKELILKYHTCIFDSNPNGYNMTFGGEGHCGYKLSDERRKEMSLQRMGENNGFYGKKHSESQKLKWSKDRKGKNTGIENPFFGRKHSEESKLKLSELAKKRTGELNPNYGNHKLAGKNHPMYGKHLSEETRKKIAKARTGNPTTGRPIVCIETGKEYRSIVEAAKDLGLDNSTVGKCCKGICKSVKGYHFSFI